MLFLGLGGNIGNTEKIFRQLLIKFRQDGLVLPWQISKNFKNPPFGYLNQPDFVNAVLVCGCSLSPDHLLRYTQKIERYFGRVKNFQDGPRTLDIDILLYGNYKISKSYLTIPHPGAFGRESVLTPLLSLDMRYRKYYLSKMKKALLIGSVSKNSRMVDGL